MEKDDCSPGLLFDGPHSKYPALLHITAVQKPICSWSTGAAGTGQRQGHLLCAWTTSPEVNSLLHGCCVITPLRMSFTWFNQWGWNQAVSRQEPHGSGMAHMQGAPHSAGLAPRAAGWLLVWMQCDLGPPRAVTGVNLRFYLPFHFHLCLMFSLSCITMYLSLLCLHRYFWIKAILHSNFLGLPCLQFPHRITITVKQQYLHEDFPYSYQNIFHYCCTAASVVLSHSFLLCIFFLHGKT